MDVIVELHIFKVFLTLLYVSEILEYAKKIGINIEQESHLLHLAKEGVVQKLPPEWKPW